MKTIDHHEQHTRYLLAVLDSSEGKPVSAKRLREALLYCDKALSNKVHEVNEMANKLYRYKNTIRRLRKKIKMVEEENVALDTDLAMEELRNK